MKNILVVAMLISLSCNSQSFSVLSKNLEGRWFCLQDTNYSILFKNDTIFESYSESNGIDIYRYRIGKDLCTNSLLQSFCEIDCLYIYKEDLKNEGYFCYFIRNISESYLTLIYEGGQVIDFKKQNN